MLRHCAFHKSGQQSRKSCRSRYRGFHTKPKCDLQKLRILCSVDPACLPHQLFPTTLAVGRCPLLTGQLKQCTTHLRYSHRIKMSVRFASMCTGRQAKHIHAHITCMYPASNHSAPASRKQPAGSPMMNMLPPPGMLPHPGDPTALPQVPEY